MDGKVNRFRLEALLEEFSSLKEILTAVLPEVEQDFWPLEIDQITVKPLDVKFLQSTPVWVDLHADDWTQKTSERLWLVAEGEVHEVDLQPMYGENFLETLERYPEPNLLILVMEDYQSTEYWTDGGIHRRKDEMFFFGVIVFKPSEITVQRVAQT